MLKDVNMGKKTTAIFLKMHIASLSVITSELQGSGDHKSELLWHLISPFKAYFII